MTNKEELIKLLNEYVSSNKAETTTATLTTLADYLISNDVIIKKKGKWIDVNKHEYLDPRLKCSLCGDIEILYKGNFCPNCGAIMKGCNND